MSNQTENTGNKNQSRSADVRLSAADEKRLREKYIREYKENRKRAMTKFVPIVCIAVIVVAFAIVALSLSKGDDESSTSSGGSTYVDEDGNLIVPDGYDYLPENAVGSWETAEDAHVLQSPRNSQMSEEDALAAEQQSELMLAYDSFSTSRVSEVLSPCYKVTENCDLSALDEAGIQSDGIAEEFGDSLSIVKIEVYGNDGQTLADTVFLINDTYLIYYGTGDFVFSATKIEAVG